MIGHKGYVLAFRGLSLAGEVWYNEFECYDWLIVMAKLFNTKKESYNVLTVKSIFC